MDDDDRGWPLEKETIRAKYDALVKKDIMERQMFKAKSKNLGYDGHMLKQILVHLSKSKSTQEAYSRARSLQRVLRRAGLDTSGKGSHSVPISSPSSVEPDCRATFSSHRSRVVDTEDVLPMINASNGVRSHGTAKNGKETRFHAKQFKLISKNVTTPRRNIKILAKDTSPSDGTCGTKVIFVSEKIERNQLQERIRVHDDSDKSGPSPNKIVAENLTAQDGSSLRLDSLSRSPGPLMPRKMSSSSGRYINHNSHASSPSSVISEVVSDVFIPEYNMSSVENELTECISKLRSERWTSREIFGSFDSEGELDIAATVAEARNQESYTTTSDYDHDCLDDSTNSPSSGMRSPRQSLATSSQGGVTVDNDHHYRGRIEYCGVGIRRMKVTSPSSMFRDGPCRDQSSPNIPRKLSRKLSTSFNKRRKQAMMAQSHRRHEGLSTCSPDMKIFDEVSSSNETVAKGNLALQIAGLMSRYRATSKISKAGYGGISNGAILQQEAVAAFQDEIAQLMLDRSENDEITDIEEFLDGYMQLRSPFYLEVVEEFFRDVSYDCFKRPLEMKKAPKVPRVPKKVIRH